MIKHIFLVVCIMGLYLSSSGASFSDISDNMYVESIVDIQNRGIVQWYPDGTFKPNQGITRAEILKIVLEATIDVNWSIDHIFDCFPDATDQWYAVYVCYAKQSDIVKWYPDGTFKPDKAVTIAEALKIAFETFAMPVTESSDDRWYEPYIDFAHNNNIFSKYAVYPDSPMTRWQMAYLVHQLVLAKEWSITFTHQRSNKSPGCFVKNEPTTPPQTSMVNGIQREYITDIWSKYNHSAPSKLIFAFHGRTNSHEEVRSYYNLDRVWDNNEIIVYPAGLPAWGGRGWSNGWDLSDELRDFSLFDQLVEEFSNNYCIDMDEIYVVGHSLWAWFTNTLACARWDIIRGIGSVWWSMTSNICTWPVAAIIMHNPKDNLASFGWWLSARDQLLAQNQCNPDIYTPLNWPENANCVEYTDCLDGAPVVRCPHTQDYGWGSYYPHNWPEFAASEIWDFFFQK